MKTKQMPLKKSPNSRGVALITALLLLMLFTVMTLSMVIATTSDTLINGYYRNARGSFYGADSGVNSARQYILNQFTANIPNPYTAYSTTVPVQPGVETTIISNLLNASTGFGAYQSVDGSQTSWPGSFIISSATLGTPTCTIHYTSSTGTIPTCTNPGNGSATYYQYSYPYQVTAIGQSRASETQTVTDLGTILITTTIQSTTSSSSSFAAWGMFINTFPICTDGTLVAGTISGPVFTNGSWTFGTGGSYIFTDAVGQAGADLGYSYSDGTCNQSTTHPNSYGSQNISPNFEAGVSLNQNTIALPANSYNQEQAVLDGIGSTSTSPSDSTLNAVLKNVSGTAYPTTGASSGVYLPYSTASGGACPCTFTGGGIYVEGNASVTITASGTTAQVYTIVQGGTTTTVTINNTTNTTTISNGTTTKNITGVPVQNNSSGAFSRDATMLYVDGNISALQGGGQGVGTIQNTTALDVVANGTVNITGDILYKSEPVTLTQSGSTAADTLIPANNYGQALGIFTANGNINLNNLQSNGNLEVDASLATINSNNSSIGLTNTGAAINTLTIVGGRIQNTIQNINTTTRNVWFDRRYAQGGFSPPWFPSTTVTNTTTYATPVPVVSAKPNFLGRCNSTVDSQTLQAFASRPECWAGSLLFAIAVAMPRSASAREPGFRGGQSRN